jgi:hypothetical protein
MNSLSRNVFLGRGALWFGLFGGAIAWTIHLTLAYAAAEFGCASGLGERRWQGLSMVAWMELALTAATALAAGAATMAAWASHRRLHAAAEKYAARIGLLTSGAFTFIILFESIPILFYWNGC